MSKINVKTGETITDDGLHIKYDTYKSEELINKLITKGKYDAIPTRIDILVNEIEKNVYQTSVAEEDYEAYLRGEEVEVYKDFHNNLKAKFTEEELAQLKVLIDGIYKAKELFDTLDSIKDDFKFIDTL